MSRATSLACALALLAVLPACGVTPSAAPTLRAPAAQAAVLARQSEKEIAQRLLEEKLNADGPTFGEIEEVQLMETAKAGVYNFTLVKAYQDDYQNMWQDSFVGTVDVKRKVVKAKRTKHEEV